MKKKIEKLLEDLSKEMELAELEPSGLSTCHNFPAYVGPDVPRSTTRYYICGWCGHACTLKKPDHGE